MKKSNIVVEYKSQKYIENKINLKCAVMNRVSDPPYFEADPDPDPDPT